MSNRSITTRTKKGNCYLYNRKERRLALCHPLIDELCNVGEPGEESLKNYSPEELNHYRQKHAFYQKHGYFSDYSEEQLSDDLLEEDVEKGIIDCPQLTFEVTDACNLACDYCAYGKFYANFAERHDSMMEFSTAKATIDYFYKLWNSGAGSSLHEVKYISFYGGEPLMNIELIKQVVEYVNSLPQKGYSVRFSMTTNGVLLDRYIDYLVEHNFGLIISLDGDREAHSYRVFHNDENSYDRIYRNVKAIQESYPAYFREQVSFNAVLHNRNSVENTLEYFKREFSKIPDIGELNFLGIKDEMVAEFKEKFLNLAEALDKSEEEKRKMLENEAFLKLQTVQEVGDFMINYLEGTYRTYLDLPGKRSKRLPSGTCLPFSKKIFVAVDGRVYACERIGQENLLGRVKDGTLDIDSHELFLLYKRLFAEVLPVCCSCWNGRFCETCILSTFLVKENRLEGKQCSSFMNEQSFRNYFGYILTKIESNPETFKRIDRSIAYEKTK